MMLYELHACYSELYISPRQALASKSNFWEKYYTTLVIFGNPAHPNTGFVRLVAVRRSGSGTLECGRYAFTKKQYDYTACFTVDDIYNKLLGTAEVQE